MTTAEPRAEHPHLGTSAAGSVILDIGDGVGALMVNTPAAMNGAEIEISGPGGAATRRVHSQVRERRAAGTVLFAAVYPALEAGEYTVWRDPSTAAGAVTITGGQVTSWNWP